MASRELNIDRSAGPDACWPWMGARDRNGYGRLGRKLAHRLVTNAPHGVVMRHACDNPPCCNPAHLRAGTQADNLADMVAKGRARHRAGEAHPKARLTVKDVLLIRATPLGPGVAAALADRFGISRRQVYIVRTGQQWQSVPRAS